MRLISQQQSSDEEDPEEESDTPKRYRSSRGKKSGKLYTADYRVTKTLPWPHQFVPRINGAKAPKHHELSIGQFVYGYMAIALQQTADEKAEMEDHLLLLLKDECQYGWEPVREYHQAWLEAIEQGAASWGDTAAREELRRTFIWAPAAPARQPAASIDKPAASSKSTGKAQPCVDYNRGKCHEKKTHGSSKHVCSYCNDIGMQHYHPVTLCRLKGASWVQAPKNG